MASLFEGDVEVDPTIIDPNKNYLEELVGDGKKFDTPESLARGKAEADAFINKLTQELREERERAKAAVTMQDFLDRLEKSNTTTVQPSIPDNGGERTDPPLNQLTQDSVKDLIRQTLEQETRARREDENLSFVQGVLSDKFGNTAPAILAQKAKSLGLGTAFLDNLAKEQPKAFLALMGVDTNVRDQPSQPTRTALNSNPGSVRTSQKNYAYYRKMMKENPDLYRSAAIHREMLSQIQEMGEENFYAP